MPQGDLYAARVWEEYKQILARLGLQDLSRDLQNLQSIDEGDPTPVPGWIYHAGENDIPYPELIRKAEPIYPEKGRVERVSGNVVLESVDFVIPLRPQVNASFCVYTYAGRLRVLMHHDPRVIADKDGEDLLETYIGRIRRSIDEGSR